MSCQPWKAVTAEIICLSSIKHPCHLNRKLRISKAYWLYKPHLLIFYLKDMWGCPTPFLHIPLCNTLHHIFYGPSTSDSLLQHLNLAIRLILYPCSYRYPFIPYSSTTHTHKTTPGGFARPQSCADPHKWITAI